MLLAGLRRAFWIALGYVMAVLVAVVIAEAIMLAPTALPDQGRFGSIFASLRDLGGLFAIGVSYTFIFALPGFLIVVAIASARKWCERTPFVISGAANAMLSLMLFAAYFGSPLTGIVGMTIYCVPGGFAGGLACWKVAYGYAGSRLDSPPPLYG